MALGGGNALAIGAADSADSSRRPGTAGRAGRVDRERYHGNHTSIVRPSERHRIAAYIIIFARARQTSATSHSQMTVETFMSYNCPMPRTASISLAVGLALLGAGANPAVAQIRVERDIKYIANAMYADNKDKLDIFIPAGAKSAPVIISLYGGALTAGDNPSSPTWASDSPKRGTWQC